VFNRGDPAGGDHISICGHQFTFAIQRFCDRHPTDPEQGRWTVTQRQQPQIPNRETPFAA
jgi:hypothetical protein